MSERVCACPCKGSLEGMKPSARYATNACRTRHYRERKLGGEETSPVTSQRRTKPSGLQISFWKAQQALQEFLEAHNTPASHKLAVDILERAMSDKQREELRARKRAKRQPTLTVAEQRESFEQQDLAA